MTPKQLIDDGAVTWKVQSLNRYGVAGGGDAPGTIKMIAGNIVPEGYLLCDGSAVSRENYADLFAAIGTAWGAGDGSTTFNLPNSIGHFPEGNWTAGGYIGAGLPNIYGELHLDEERPVSVSGSFYKTYSGAVPMTFRVNGAGESLTIAYNAATSSGYYGRSATVQPEAFLVRYIIKY